MHKNVYLLSLGMCFSISIWTSTCSKAKSVCDGAEEVTVQNVLLDLAAQMGVMMGQQYASTLLSQQDQATQKALVDQITQLQQDFKTKQKELSEAIAAKNQALGHTFSQQLAMIQQSMSNTQVLAQARMNYLQKLIVSATPSQLLLPARMGDQEQRQILRGADQFFAASRMNTPGLDHPWYNMFPRGNWAYDTALDAFIQRGVDFSTAQQPGSIINTLSSQCTKSSNQDNPEFNLIFTELYTNKPTYTIQIEVTLINCGFPFFAGIVCNKARLIPGNLDRMCTYRCVGFYGTSAKNIGLYAGQTVVQDGVSISPLALITNNQSNQLFTLPANDLAQLGQAPLTYVITIVTQQAQISVELKKKGDGSSTQSLFSTSIPFDDQLSQLIFWYHGLGFMAPGCQAQFKIIKQDDADAPTNQLIAQPNTTAKG